MLATDLAEIPEASSFSPPAALANPSSSTICGGERTVSRWTAWVLVLAMPLHLVCSASWTAMA
jgi:hypothetical protein